MPSSKINLMPSKQITTKIISNGIRVLRAFIIGTALFSAHEVLAQSQSPMGSSVFPVNDNYSGSVTAAVNGGWQINGFGKVSKIVPYSTGILFACTASGGIYKSTDAGNNWTSISGSFLPGVQMNSMAVDPLNSNIMYAGTGEISYAEVYGWGGYGVFKSTDAGITWSISNSGMGNQVVTEVLINQSNASHIVASAENGIYKSVNSGATWTKQAISGSWVQQVVQKGNSDTLFAISGDSLFMSPDFGDNWNVRNLDPVASSNYLKGRIAISPSNTNVIYATWIINLAGNYSQSEIFKSVNGGSTFVKTYSSSSLPALSSYDGTVNGGGYGWANYAIVVDPTNSNTVYTGAHLFFKSTDGAQSFSSTISGWWCCIHTDIQDIIFDPTNNTRILAATDGGIFVSSNQGVAWQPSSNGLNCSQYYSFGQGHVDSNFVVGGLQDNGIMYLNTDNNIHTYAGGDYNRFTLCDYFNPHNVYTSSSGGKVFDPYNRANSASINLPVEIAGVSETPCIEFSQLNAGRAFSFKSNVWVSSNLNSYTMSSSGGSSSVSWTKLTNLTGLNIMALAIAPNNDDLIYFITDNGKFYTATLSSGSLLAINNISLPGQSNIAASISISTLNPDVIYVTANDKVYHSSNAGVFFEDITANLPSINFQAIYIDPFSTIEGLYIVSDLGVFYTDWTLPSWTNLNADFQPNTSNPNAVFYQLIAGSGIYKGSNSATSHVSLGTWGAGFQKVNFYEQKCHSLPADWQLKSYGPTFSTNAACYDGTNGGNGGSNAYSVTSNGSQIGGTADQFSLVQSDLSGDGSIKCVIYSVEKEDTLSPGETGLMLRNNSGSANSPFIMIGVNANGEIFLKYRTLSGMNAIDSIVNLPSVPYPIELKLIKTGNTFSSYYGGILIAQHSIQLGDTIVAGIAAAAGSSTLMNHTAFGDIIDSGFVHIITGINETILPDVVLFPDPAHNSLTLKLNGVEYTNYKVFDLLGRKVLEGNIPTNSLLFNIDISKLLVGNYMIDLGTRKGNASGRLKFVKN